MKDSESRNGDRSCFLCAVRTAGPDPRRPGSWFFYDSPGACIGIRSRTVKPAGWLGSKVMPYLGP